MKKIILACISIILFTSCTNYCMGTGTSYLVEAEGLKNQEGQPIYYEQIYVEPRPSYVRPGFI